MPLFFDPLWPGPKRDRMVPGTGQAKLPANAPGWAIGLFAGRRSGHRQCRCERRPPAAPTRSRQRATHRAATAAVRAAGHRVPPARWPRQCVSRGWHRRRQWRCRFRLPLPDDSGRPECAAVARPAIGRAASTRSPARSSPILRRCDCRYRAACRRAARHSGIPERCGRWRPLAAPSTPARAPQAERWPHRRPGWVAAWAWGQEHRSAAGRPAAECRR